MGILSSIFGDSKHAGEIIDGAKKGLDKIVFTKEEKADANQKLSDWYLKYLETTQPQNLARRYIALIIVGVWALLVVLGVMGHAVESMAGVEPVMSGYIFRVLADVVMNPFLLVVGFYFLTHTVRAYTNGKK